MGRNALVAVAAAMAMLGSVPAVAGATPLSALLTGVNGDGSFNDRQDCDTPENGAGDTWRYAWQDQPATDLAGVLDGRWNGSFEVHRAAAGAFVPAGDGHLALTVASGGRTGTAFFDTAGTGSCSDAPLTLTQLEADDPTAQQVSGSLPVVATGGLGALRGLTGSGTLTNLSLDLTPGADNAARMTLSGDLDVPDPAVSVASATARWANLTAWLAHKLTVTLTVKNAAAAGDAFGVQVTSASGGSFEGVPTASATLPAGATTTLTFVIRNASAGHSATIGVSVASKDALLAAQPPVTGTVKVQAPLLP